MPASSWDVSRYGQESWHLGAILLVRVFSAWAGLGKVGQTGFPSLCKGFQPNNSNYFRFSNSFFSFASLLLAL